MSKGSRRPDIPQLPEGALQTISNFLGGSANNGTIDPEGFHNYEYNQLFNQWLAGLSGSGNQDILQMLYAILQQYSSKDDTNRQDLGNLMSWLMTLNQREYDKSQTLDQRRYEQYLLENQRAYDSPSAELSRLMATGMSREQALQMLGGSSAQITPSAPFTGAAPSVSASGSNETMQNLQKIGAAFNIFSSLASFGISGFAAGATASLQSAQTLALQQAEKAQQSSARLNLALWNKQKSGADFSGLSFDDVAKKYASDPEISPLLDDLMSSPGAYAIGSGNYNVRFGNLNQLSFAAQQDAASIAARLQPILIQQAILKNNADYDKTLAEISNIEAQTDYTEQLLPYQLSLLDSQAELADAQAEQSHAQTSVIEEQRKIIAIAAHREQLTASDLDATAIYQAAVQMRIAAAQNDPAYLGNLLQSMINDQKSRRAFSAFNVLRYTNLNQLSSDPNLLEFHNLCEQLNLGQFLIDGVKKGTIDPSPELRNFLETFGYQSRSVFSKGTPAPIQL